MFSLTLMQESCQHLRKEHLLTQLSCWYSGKRFSPFLEDSEHVLPIRLWRQKVFYGGEKAKSPAWIQSFLRKSNILNAFGLPIIVPVDQGCVY